MLVTHLITHNHNEFTFHFCCTSYISSTVAALKIHCLNSSFPDYFLQVYPLTGIALTDTFEISTDASDPQDASIYYKYFFQDLNGEETQLTGSDAGSMIEKLLPTGIWHVFFCFVFVTCIRFRMVILTPVVLLMSNWTSDDLLPTES